MTIIIDAAVGGPWEALGDLLRDRGKEDASGARRFLAARLAQRDFNTVTTYLGINEHEARDLRQRFVDAFGETE